MATLKAGSTAGGEKIISASSSGTAGQRLKSDGDGTFSWSSVAWTEVSSRPTALSSFTNDLGNYGSFVTNCNSSVGIAGGTLYMNKTNNNFALTFGACNCVCDCRD